MHSPSPDRPCWKRPTLACLAVSCLSSLLACGPADDSGPRSLRLVDLFESATVTGSSEASPVEPTEWRFEEGLNGWQAGPGTADVAVRDGLLVGRSTSEYPFVHVERLRVSEGRDLVHAVEVRARVSAGANLEVHFSSEEELDLDGLRGRLQTFPGDNRTSVEARAELETYVVVPDRPVEAGRTRHLVLRPTDVADAEFAVESVRLVFRREHLASIDSGIGWHGLADVFRETVVSRAPESLTYALDLPRRPRLDLAVGTIEERPVTFTVEIADGARTSTVLERTVTRPHRWESARVDLDAWAGRPVELSLRLSAESEGSLGFWGSPAVREVGAGSGDGRPRSVLVIVADTLRSDHLGLYGYGRPTAPALARAAAEGVAFTDCIAQGTWTKVSFSSILSGLHPLTHGVKEFHDRLPASATTLAEVFRGAGYATLSLSSISFNGKFTNLHQGFEVLYESGSLPSDAASKTAVHYADELLPWLEANRAVPFFALLHVADPHAPYRPYAPYDHLWAESGNVERFDEQVEKVRPAIEDPLMRRFGMPTTEELEEVGLDPQAFTGHELDWYDGSIRAMDAELGRVFERLRDLDLEDDVLVVFLADHGTEFLEHGRHWHGHSVYGELSRVPLVLWGAGVAPGEAREETVQTIDVMPTILDAAGLAAPPAVQGTSLLPLVRGEPWRPRPAFSYKAALDAPVGPPPNETESVAFISEGWKLVHHSRRPEGGKEYELFDHREDPLNLRDVASQHPERVERMAAALADWRRKVEAERVKGDEALGELSDEELERLRSLGYVD